MCSRIQASVDSEVVKVRKSIFFGKITLSETDYHSHSLSEISIDSPFKAFFYYVIKILFLLFALFIAYKIYTFDLKHVIDFLRLGQEAQNRLYILKDVIIGIVLFEGVYVFLFTPVRKLVANAGGRLVVLDNYSSREGMENIRRLI